MRERRHTQLRARDPAALERVDFREQRRQVDDHAVADHRRHVRIQHAAWHQLQRVTLAADDDGVPRVVSALVSNDVAVRAGEQVDDFCLALITHWVPTTTVTGIDAPGSVER